MTIAIEEELISYLRTYGNTRESDLSEYGVLVSNLSMDDVKRVLDRMVLDGKASRIIHNKLVPEVVYLTQGNWCERDMGERGLALLVEAEAHGLKDEGKISEEAGRILNEAAILAEKRIREKFPEDYKKSRRPKQARKQRS